MCKHESSRSAVLVELGWRVQSKILHRVVSGAY